MQYLYIKNQYPAETAELKVEEKDLYNDTYVSKPRNQEIVVSNDQCRTLSCDWQAASQRNSPSWDPKTTC
jgi:hypothetical protein